MPLPSFRLAIISTFAFTVSGCVASGTALTPVVQDEGPALWRLADDDTEIVFLGTVHLLPETLDWQRQDLRVALENADLVYLETDVRSVSQDDQLTFTRLGSAADGEHLTDLLDEATFQDLETALAGLNISVSFLAERQPWYAALALSRVALESHGFLSEFGAENWVLRELADTTRPVRSLETMSDVARNLSALPMPTQLTLLTESLADLGGLKSRYVETIETWVAGDTQHLHELVMADLAENLPEVYDALIVARNRNWLPQVTNIMEEETGNVVIAVGSAHLIGPDSLLNMLESEGWSVERY